MQTSEKGSTGSLETSGGSGGSRSGLPLPSSGITKSDYPIALALRLRVVQIVCGIGTVVMGSVAAIEERGQFNLSLGVPAGVVTVLAAGWSVHRSIQGSGEGHRACRWCARLLCLVACLLQSALFVLAMRSLMHRHQYGHEHTSNTSVGVAATQGVLAACALGSTLLSARIRLLHGPAPGAIPSRNARYPRSTSHTAVSMVPLASNYFGTSTTNEITNSRNDNSENEMMEISLGDIKPNHDVSPMDDRRRNDGVKVKIANNNSMSKMESKDTLNVQNKIPNGTEKNNV